MAMCSAAATIHHANAMGIINHQPCVMLLADREQVADRGEIAIHREHAICDNHAMGMRIAMSLQQFAQMLRIIVAECFDLCA